MLSLHISDHAVHCRNDVALWKELFEMATVRVAKLRQHRENRLARLAEYGRENIEYWDEIAQDLCARKLEFIAYSTTHFALTLTTGPYEDDALQIHFELSAPRGIGRRYTGLWHDPPKSVKLPSVQSPSDVTRIAKRFIDDAMNDARKRLPPIPDPEAYAAMDDSDDDAPSLFSAVKLSREEQKIVDRNVRDLTRESTRENTPRAKRKQPARRRARSTLLDGLGVKTGTDSGA